MIKVEWKKETTAEKTSQRFVMHVFDSAVLNWLFTRIVFLLSLQ